MDHLFSVWFQQHARGEKYLVHLQEDCSWICNCWDCSTGILGLRDEDLDPFSLFLGRKSLKSVCLCVNKPSYCLACGKVVKWLLLKGAQYKCHIPGWSLCWAQRQNV